MKIRIYALFFAVLVAGLYACARPSHKSGISNQHANDELAMVEIKNPSDFKRPNQGVFLSYYDLGLKTDDPHSLVIKRSDALLPLQKIDVDGDAHYDGIYFQLDLEPAQTAQISVLKTKETPESWSQFAHAEISVKEGGQWVAHSKKPNSGFKEYQGGEFRSKKVVETPEYYTDHSNWIRYEGPGIESDKIAYRIYLDWRNGFDIFGKVKARPVLHTIGLDGYDSYHEMQDWGMDILKVGQSLGAGGFAAWHNDKIEYIKNVERHRAEITRDGPLKSTIKIDYLGWLNRNQKQDLNAHISMEAGSHLAKVELKFSQPLSSFVAGFVKHKHTELIAGDINITGKAYSYIASWGKQALDGSDLGMAVFFKKEDLLEIKEDKNNYFVVLKTKGPKESRTLDYYYGAVWSPQSNIVDKKGFKAWLNKEQEKLTIAPRIKIKNTLHLNSDTQQIITAETALNWSKAMADSELKRKAFRYARGGWDVNRNRSPKFEYDIVGLLPFSIEKLHEISGESRYKELVPTVTGSYVNDDGTLSGYKKDNYNIDSILPGRNLLTLYQKTGEEKYKKAASVLRQQLIEHPRTKQGAFWHKKRYPHQLWLDGVYMGMPFLAEYTSLFEDGRALDEVVHEFEITYQQLRDRESGLYYHAWDESKQQSWADPVTGLSEFFWARGMGWFAMALVDVLDYIPQDRSDLRKPLLKIAGELSESLAEVQDDSSGVWWQILDKPNTTGNYLESSASSMFVYFYAKALVHGYIPDSYADTMEKAYRGIINEFMLVHENGEVSMTNQCLVAGLGFGRDGSYQYYMTEPVWANDPKGTGPFILASAEVFRFLSRAEASIID
jgi:rhamnogalacturonyl hydrolase YesR